MFKENFHKLLVIQFAGVRCVCIAKLVAYTQHDRATVADIAAGPVGIFFFLAWVS